MPAWMQTILGWVGKSLQAIFASAVAGLGALITALAQIGEGGAVSEISQLAWATIALTALVAFGGVFGLSNNKGT